MPSTPDVAFINLEYASAIVAHVELSWLAPSKLRRTTVVGSQKMVVYDDTSNEPVRVFDSGVTLRDPETFGEYQLTYRTGDIVSKHVAPEEPLLARAGRLLQRDPPGEPPRSSAQLGLDVVRMIEAVDSSLAGDGARVGVARCSSSTSSAEHDDPRLVRGRAVDPEVSARCLDNARGAHGAATTR